MVVGDEERWVQGWEGTGRGGMGHCTSGGGPMTESTTGSSTSPLSSPSSVRTVSTAKKYLGGGTGGGHKWAQPP